MRQCEFILKDGKQCRALAVKGSRFCFSHDPAYKEKKALAVKKGGLAKKRFFLDNPEKITLENAHDAKKFLAMVINGVWTGSIPATPVANTLGFLIRCFLDAYERADIEARITEIERKIEERG